ncbi:MAG: hypothetical protein CVV04_09110 [Firmicutes bacterium HGW-Firmicutes-9]|jgi:hypothetical protein|nr:MAG: hypothetical protein CVV04_09110 [Firmicutes bacterium HGW-Firmicutes-9]
MEQYTAPLTPEQQSHNKSSVTAMVLGIISLVVTWFPIIGLVLAIIGLTMSRSNRKFAEAHGFKENSMNTAGYVTSLVGLILGIITIVVTVLVIAFGFVVLAGVIQYTDMPRMFYW